MEQKYYDFIQPLHPSPIPPSPYTMLYLWGTHWTPPPFPPLSSCGIFQAILDYSTINVLEQILLILESNAKQTPSARQIHKTLY